MKQIVVLEQTQPQTFRYVLRANVPVSRQPFYAALQGTAVSVYQDPDGPTQVADQVALRAGQIAERVDNVSVTALSIAQIEAFLQNAQIDFQTQVNAANPWLRYGSFYDGAAWTIKVIA